MYGEVQQRSHVAKRKNWEKPKENDYPWALMKVDDEQRKKEPKVEINPYLPTPMQPRHDADGFEKILAPGAVIGVSSKCHKCQPQN